MILASELTHRTLWYPTILGVLVVVAGVVLFCGSIYLLLGTNLGARLGFLVSFTGLAGFMVILTALWCTTSSPLNTLKGRISGWEVQQVVPDLTKADKAAARTIVTKSNEVDVAAAANVKAAVDAKLVRQVETPTHTPEEDANDFAKFDIVTDYEILGTWVTGGSNPQFWKGEFTHSEQVAVVQYCQVAEPDPDRAFGLPPLPPECADGGETGYVILVKDLGSLRVPPFVAFVVSSILFVLGLLLLHWRERDEQDAEADASGEAKPNVPERVPAGV